MYACHSLSCLFIQLSRCVEEFESLVSLSTSLLEGQEPTPAMLFGPDGIYTCTCTVCVFKCQAQFVIAMLQDMFCHQTWNY